MTEPSGGEGGLRNGLRRLLRPSSVAVVGASDDPASIGGAPISLLERFGFPGEVHLVSRSRARIGSRPCLRSIDDLPYGVDAAVLAIPRAGVLEAVEAAARRGVGGVVVFASGYGELGPAGRSDEEALAEAARLGGVALAGPNCLGLVNFVDAAPLTFAHAVPNWQAAERGVAVVAQSGALSMALTYAALAQGVMVTYAISTGNEAVAGVEDYLELVLEDERTGAVAMLVEQVRQPSKILALARTAAKKGVALCLLHTGRSARAREASLTHTGAIAGNQAVLRAALDREGILLVDSLDELVDAAGILARYGPPSSPGIAFMTDSGAAKTHALDLAQDLGLDLPSLADATLDRLGRELPSFATAGNPVDITAMGLNDPGLYARVAGSLLDDPSVGSLVVAAMPGSDRQGTEQVDALLPTLSGASKPVIYTIMGGDWPLPEANRSRILDAGVPLLRSPERALRAAGHLAHLAERRAPAAERVRPVRLDLPEGVVLGEPAAKDILRSLGLRVPAGSLAHDAAEAKSLADRLGYPVVLKAVSPELRHKSDAGAVGFVHHADDLAASYESLLRRLERARPALVLEGVLVEEMVRGGVEVLLGARRDPDWGPYLVVGLGGIFTEVLGDAVVLMADAGPAEITEALTRLRGFPLLEGARGSAPGDLPALVAAVQRVGAAILGSPTIAEIEVNPLLVLPCGLGAVALDALVVGIGGAPREG